MENTPNLQCGKMYREHSAATKEKISEPCWKTCRTYVNQEFLFLDLEKEGGQNPAVFSETDGALLGEQWTPNIRKSVRWDRRISTGVGGTIWKTYCSLGQ